VHPDGDAAKAPAEITYGAVFTLMPFGNTLIVKTLTGEALLALLEQQFDNPAPGLVTILQVSHNVRFSYNPARPAGSRVNRASLTIDGKPIDPARSYRVAMVDFLWDGGDGFTTAKAGTDGVGVGLDIDVFMSYLAAHSPLGPRPGGRITRER
jgi:5'-nucleotidase